jgi:hypothetical protein
MSDLTPARISFLFRQGSLIEFGLGNALHGICNGSLLHLRLTYSLSGVYATLVAFLLYFLCERLSYTHNHSMPIYTSDEREEANIIQDSYGIDCIDVYPTDH